MPELPKLLRTLLTRPATYLRYFVTPVSCKLAGGTRILSAWLISLTLLNLMFVPLQAQAQTDPTEQLLLHPQRLGASLNYGQDEIQAFLDKQPGQLKTYQVDYLPGVTEPVAQVVMDTNILYQVNSQLLLVLLELQTGLVSKTNPQLANFANPFGANPASTDFLAGFSSGAAQLYDFAANYKPGATIRFADGTTLATSTRINAATYAIQAFLAARNNQTSWKNKLADFVPLYTRWFGDPLSPNSGKSTPTPDAINSPAFPSLPWPYGMTGVITGGPHDGGKGGIDFYSDSHKITSIADGTVAAVKTDGTNCESVPAGRDPTSYGNYVLVSYSGNFSGWYGYYYHLATNAVMVSAGQAVSAGTTVLGIQGHTGRTLPCNASGEHLHLQFDVDGTSYSDNAYNLATCSRGPVTVNGHNLCSGSIQLQTRWTNNPPQSGNCTIQVDDTGCGDQFRAEGNPAGLHTASGYCSVNDSFTYTQNSPDPSGTDHNKFTWRANLPQAGYYYVEVNIPCNYATTTNAQYWIHYRGGQTKTVVNQNISSNWIRLKLEDEQHNIIADKWPFDAGTSAYIDLDDVTGEPYLSKYIGIDAIRWVYAGPLDQPPTLISISIAPAYSIINIGATQQFKATGNYSNGSSADITSSVTWNSNKTTVATINAAGLATGIAAGGAVITASRDGISGTTNLSVQDPNNQVGVNTRISTQRGFDKCEAASASDLQAWMNQSPFRDVNIYIGGSLRACPQPNLNAAWVSQVSKQGWGLIPTWVGPQAPCSSFSIRMSSDIATAQAQGRDEATAAAQAATALGLGGSIIYYDLERYTSGGSCSEAVKSFIFGWTQQLHALNFKAGVYGSPTNAASDWRIGVGTPDAVWLALWVCNNQNDEACYAGYTPSVYGLAPLNDGDWAYHQRIHQYRGDHNETYAGITFNIDSDIEDAPVAIVAVNNLEVTQPLDTGDTEAVGTLSRALKYAQSGQTITINLPAGTNNIAIKGNLLPLKAGVKIQGGCGSSGPTVTVDGTDPAASANGLTLGGNNTISGLRLRGFRNLQIVTVGSLGNRFECTAISKY